MTVNFIHQLDLATSYPDIWLNINSECICESVPKRLAFEPKD